MYTEHGKKEVAHKSMGALERGDGGIVIAKTGAKRVQSIIPNKKE
jgi:hypothetical protein